MMNQRIKNLLEYILSEKHHQYRREDDVEISNGIKQSLKELRSIKDRSIRLVVYLDNEVPVILPNERIAIMRTLGKQRYYGGMDNNVPDYWTIIRKGLNEQRNDILNSLELYKNDSNEESQSFLLNLLRVIDSIKRFAEKYSEHAKHIGNFELYQIFCNISKYGAKTFHEALQFLRLLNFVYRYDNNNLSPLGRFDQYMYPYLKADLDAGRIDYEEALELVEDFFINLNKDSDLYLGVQKGDNGQSIVLGGVDDKGNPTFNILSEICLKAAKELKLIDPKINLRINKDTPLEVYELGTELTKEGLGFPQYSNDDIIIPGLVELGYSLEDARNYAVAACWEPIIPGVGMEIVNLDTFNFVKVIDIAVYKYLTNSNSFDEFLTHISEVMRDEFVEMQKKYVKLEIKPSLFQSLLNEKSIEIAVDISKCSKYNNIGIHGPGLACAADSLAAIKKYIFEEKLIAAQDLIAALDVNFQNYDEIWHVLRYKSPKMGKDNDYVDHLGSTLLEMYSDTLKQFRNPFGGIYRPGTGSASFYIFDSFNIGASPDGRKKREPFPANYSPSLSVRLNGPLSVVKSFTKFDLRKTINGGPLTLELHNTVFRNKESTRKIAMFVKSSMNMGLHQL